MLIDQALKLALTSHSNYTYSQFKFMPKAKVIKPKPRIKIFDFSKIRVDNNQQFDFQKKRTSLRKQLCNKRYNSNGQSLAMKSVQYGRTKIKTQLDKVINVFRKQQKPLIDKYVNIQRLTTCNTPKKYSPRKLTPQKLNDRPKTVCKQKFKTQSQQYYPIYKQESQRNRRLNEYFLQGQVSPWI